MFQFRYLQTKYDLRRMMEEPLLEPPATRIEKMEATSPIDLELMPKTRCYYEPPTIALSGGRWGPWGAVGAGTLLSSTPSVLSPKSSSGSITPLRRRRRVKQQHQQQPEQEGEEELILDATQNECASTSHQDQTAAASCCESSAASDEYSISDNVQSKAESSSIYFGGGEVAVKTMIPIQQTCSSANSDGCGANFSEARSRDSTPPLPPPPPNLSID
eukprot:PhM_4_TR819/c0_g1_i1/m.62945